MEPASDKKNSSLRKSMGHALGKLGNSLGFGLPKSNPEKPLDTEPKISGKTLGEATPDANTPSPSPEPKVQQHAMFDRENPESKTPMGDTFGLPKTVDPQKSGAPPKGPGTLPQDQGGQEQKEAPFPDEPKPFIGLRFEKSAESLKHKYSDIFLDRSEDKAEIAWENYLITQDSFTFGLSGRRKGDSYSRKHTTTYDDLVRLSPMAITYGRPDAPDTTDTAPGTDAESQPGQGDKVLDMGKELGTVNQFASLPKEDATLWPKGPHKLAGSEVPKSEEEEQAVETEEPQSWWSKLTKARLSEGLPGYGSPGDESTSKVGQGAGEALQGLSKSGERSVDFGEVKDQVRKLYAEMAVGPLSPEKKAELEQWKSKLAAMPGRSEDEGFFTEMFLDTMEGLGARKEDFKTNILGQDGSSRLTLAKDPVSGVGEYLFDRIKSDFGGNFQNLVDMTDPEGKPMDMDAARAGAVLITAAELAMEVAGGKLVKMIPGFDNLKKEFTRRVVNAAMANDKIRAMVIQGSKQLGEGVESVIVEVSKGLTELVATEAAKSNSNEKGTEFDGATGEDVFTKLKQKGSEGVTNYITTRSSSYAKGKLKEKK